jgi:hypothetical protein
LLICLPKAELFKDNKQLHKEKGLLANPLFFVSDLSTKKLQVKKEKQHQQPIESQQRTEQSHDN